MSPQPSALSPQPSTLRHQASASSACLVCSRVRGHNRQRLVALFCCVLEQFLELFHARQFDLCWGEHKVLKASYRFLNALGDPSQSGSSVGSRVRERY